MRSLRLCAVQSSPVIDGKMVVINGLDEEELCLISVVTAKLLATICESLSSDEIHRQSYGTYFGQFAYEDLLDAMYVVTTITLVSALPDILLANCLINHHRQEDLAD